MEEYELSNLGTLATATYADWSGRQNDYGLKVVRLVSKKPVVWATKCVSCGAEMNVPHSKIAYQQCRSSACGQPVRKPSRLERERAEARERERIEYENGLRAAELRMRDEASDYTMPAKRPVTPGNSAPETERQRLERKARREELEVQEAAEREERERPIREAHTKLMESHRKLAAAQRAMLLHKTAQDPELYISEETSGLRLTPEGANEWNAYHLRLFCESHPDFHICDHNIQIFGNYWQRHGVHLVSDDMVARLYRRMVEAGIQFEQRPQPAPYDQRPSVNLKISEASTSRKNEAPVYQGWDEDGNPREYTEREVSRWSSEEMKRRLRLTAASGALELPAIGPGPRGTRY